MNNKIFFTAGLAAANLIMCVIIIRGAADAKKNEVKETVAETSASVFTAAEVDIGSPAAGTTRAAISSETEASDRRSFGFEIITRASESSGSQPASSAATAAPVTTAQTTTTAAAPVTTAQTTTTTAAPVTTAQTTTTATAPVTTAQTTTTTSASVTAAQTAYNVGRPVMEDFEWYWELEDLPDDYVLLTEPDRISGRWKCLGLYVDNDGTDLGIYELLNVDIMAGYNSATVSFDWYMIKYNGEDWEDETFMDDTVWYPSVDNGTIYGGNDSGTLSIDIFWESGGHQYGLGTLDLPDGSVGYIQLVRP